MSLILLAAALIAPMPHVSPARSSNCALPDAMLTAGRPRQGAHLLGEELSANQILAVARRIGNCPAPLVVKTGIGNSPRR